MSAGVRSLSCVVKDPNQLESGPPNPSVTVPRAVRDTEVIPGADSVRRNGDAALMEQDCPIVVTPAQLVLGLDGPSEFNIKVSPGAEGNVRKSATGNAVGDVRSNIEPTVPTPNGV